MEWWRILLGLVFMIACVGVLAWNFAQHFRRGWKDHIWVWDEANDRAVMFVVLFSALAGEKWLFYGLKDEAIIYVAVGLGFVAMPYVLYIMGRLLGIWHRSRERGRLR